MTTTQINQKKITMDNLIIDDDKKPTTIPSGHICIKLDSIGKLNTPLELHFRNYNMDELYDLADTSQEAYLEILMNCLNKMVYEDFDCKNLHEEDLKKILFGIYAKWWSKKLEGYTYYYDINKIEPKEGENRNDVIGEAIIPIKNIKTKPLGKKVKIPINIKIDNKTVKFTLPIMGMFIEAQKYLYDLYAFEERSFSDFKPQYIEYTKLMEEKKFKEAQSLDIDHKVREEYEKFYNKKADTLFRLMEAQLLVGINDENYNTIEQKLEAVKTVEGHYWKAFKEVKEKNCEFGINPEVEFMCNKAEKLIKRRFLFQFMDFIPTDHDQNVTSYDVSFGD